MRKRNIALILILTVITLFTSCRLDVATNLMHGVEKNPFIDGKPIITFNNSINQSADKFSFILTTDIHINRSKEDPGVIETHDRLIELLNQKKGSYSFVLNLGDLEDTGDINSPELLSFLSKLRDNRIDFLTCLGNHEIQEFHERAEWDALYESYGLKGTLGRYTYGNDLLSVYSMDSSKRLYGRDQLDWFEEALKQDKSKYKIIITHVDNFTGSSFDISLVQFGTADTAERNRLYKLMSEYNVGMMFNGHLHSGNLLTRLNDHIAEFNAASMQIVNFIVNQPGYYYIVDVDTTTDTMTINYYTIEDDVFHKSESVKLL